MNLIKTSFYTSFSTAITIVSSFLVIKIVAVQIGPKGIALVGQFQNTTSIICMLSTAAITSGVIKYLAEYESNVDKKNRVIHTAFVVVFFSCILISLVVMLTSVNLSEATFKSSHFWLVYFLFGLFVAAISFNMLFISILNGLKEIRKYTIVSICNSLIGVTITLIAAYSFGLVGVLLASTATAIIIFVINIFIFKKLGIRWFPNFKLCDREIIKKLSAFSLMAIVSGFAVPTMQLLVRNRIITQFSVTEAGYWQAVTKISDNYLGFITTVLAVYYLPRLSEIIDKKELGNEIRKGYKLILPVVGFLALCIWFLKSVIIHVLFTPEFLPMKSLFLFQLIGDFFKIGSWLLGYLLLAKALTKSFIITEILFAASFVILSYYFMNNYGLIGATYAFCINYAAHWILMFLITRKYYN